MTIGKQEMIEFAELVAQAVVRALEKTNSAPVVSVNPKTEKPEKTAYQKTEQLLYAYNDFRRVVDERMQEIDDLRKFGVPSKSGSIVEYSAHGGTVQGIVLEEETVENAVRRINESIKSVVDVVALLDVSLNKLKSDPYYRILELRYFEGRTQEDIAIELNCAQQTISKNKNRLVKELSLWLFPNEVATEFMR